MSDRDHNDDSPYGSTGWFILLPLLAFLGAVLYQVACEWVRP